jgi:hypothetical protein
VAFGIHRIIAPLRAGKLFVNCGLGSGGPVDKTSRIVFIVNDANPRRASDAATIMTENPDINVCVETKLSIPVEKMSNQRQITRRMDNTTIAVWTRDNKAVPHGKPTMPDAGRPGRRRWTVCW